MHGSRVMHLPIIFHLSMIGTICIRKEIHILGITLLLILEFLAVLQQAKDNHNKYQSNPCNTNILQSVGIILNFTQKLMFFYVSWGE
jgi:hypothetical protein